ncbi:primase-like DNA-binding domain-containing protein, partial [Streptococcus suis]
MLEPYEGKLSRTVLREEGGSNTTNLLDCEIGSDKKSAVSEVYPTYKQYCMDSGYKPLAKNSFNQRLVEL